jgi:tetratricopeptide (TPR) repeat protein
MQNDEFHTFAPKRAGRMNNSLIISALFSVMLAFSAMAQSSDKDEFYVGKYFNLNLSEGDRFMYESAIKDATRRITADETDYTAYFDRGLAYAALGIYVNAIKDYTQAINLNPVFREAYYNRALAKGRFGYNKESCNDLKKAMELGVEDAKTICETYCYDY